MCCDVLGVPELGKPYFARCEHLTEKGCGIYETRPVSCRDYHCIWLKGYGEDSDRPDRSGILVSAETAETEIVISVFIVREINADNFDYTIAKALRKIARYYKGKPVVQLFGQKTKVHYKIVGYDASDQEGERPIMKDMGAYYLANGPWRSKLLFRETQSNPGIK